MAKKRTRRKAGKRKTKSTSLPGWAHMLIGIALGLAVAMGIYQNDRQKAVGQPVAMAAPEPAEPVPEPVKAKAPPEPKPLPEGEEAGISFDFYDMLPNLSVEVFQEPAQPQPSVSVAAAPPVKRVATPGIYIIQTGSFSKLVDAERRKAEIALLGVESEIKRGNANGRTVYRVYTDALETTAQVNTLSARLTNAGIEILLKRVSD